VRREADGRAFLFLLNHGTQDATVEVGGSFRDALTGAECEGAVTLEPAGVAVLRERCSSPG
jgi:beta-galactosidase GanA